MAEDNVVKFPYSPADKGKPRYTIFAVEERFHKLVEDLGLRYARYDRATLSYRGVVIDNLAQYAQVAEAMKGEAGIFNLLPENENGDTGFNPFSELPEWAGDK